MSKNTGLSIHWLNSFKIKIPALLGVFFFLIVSTIAGVLYIVGKELLDDIAYDKINRAGQTIVEELNTRVATATTLVDTLANLAEQLPADVELHKRLIAHLIDYKGTEKTIAGGGIWPGPYEFDPKIERRSFFWGRDKNGVLKYFDNYNFPDGLGYHHEEWYVPTKYLSEGKTYWSKSYIDPYSLQPMVTVSAPMFKQGKHAGVATIDLKLKGLNQFLEKVTGAFNGYAFAVDRNGTFLSFPDENMAKNKQPGIPPTSLAPFITLDEMSKTISEFSSIAALLDGQNDILRKSSGNNDCFDRLPEKIAEASYQIDIAEAELITLALCNPTQPTLEHRQLFLDNDHFLNEPVFVSVITMPVTYWRIITVMPYSSAIQPAVKIYNQIVSTALLAAFISLLIIMLLLRKFFSNLSLLSTLKKQQESFSYIEDADSSLPMPETVQAMPFIGSWRWNITKCSLWWSEEIYHFCGKNPAKFKPTLKYFVRKMIHPDDMDNVLSVVKNAINTETPCGVEFRILCKGDEIKYVNVQAKIVYDTFQRAQAITGTAVDITRQKENQADLILSATTFQTQDPIVITDTKANILKVNKAFTQVTGYSAEEVLGKNLRFLKSGRQHASFYQQLWQSLIETGQFEGEIWNRHKNGSIIPQRMTITATQDKQGNPVNYIAIYSNNSSLNSENYDTLNLAFYDPLTGLANRRLLINRIEQEIKQAQRNNLLGSLLFLDLDRFKTLNDSLGHEYGDELLVQLGKRLKHELRDEDTAARLGGDEFVVLLPANNISSDAALEHALIVAKKIQNAINHTFSLYDHEYEITASIGISVFPDKIHRPDIILHQADTAMYQAKNEGRNSICFFKPEMQKRADQRLQIEKGLKQAIEFNQFALVYQPQIDAEGQCKGAEALIRWHHAEHGILLPNVFIAIADQSGLIIALSEWVINEACRQLKQWQTAGYNIDRISINISLKQFRQKGFVKLIENAINKNQIRGHQLCIEITENVIIDNIDETLQIFAALKKLGVMISIDDFGTGYSSLTQLKQLPLNQLKIDRKLVNTIATNPDTAVIVETIIAMAKHLGLSIVAEGVESDQQKQILNNSGCYLYQGFLFSKPVDAVQFLNFLKQQTMA